MWNLFLNSWKYSHHLLLFEYHYLPFPTNTTSNGCCLINFWCPFLKPGILIILEVKNKGTYCYSIPSCTGTHHLLRMHLRFRNQALGFLVLSHIIHQEDVIHSGLKTNKFSFLKKFTFDSDLFILEYTDTSKNWILHFIKFMPTKTRNWPTVQSLSWSVRIAFWNWMVTSSSKVSLKMMKPCDH